MTELTSNDIYTIGLPIALLIIILEALYSSWKNKNWYRRGDSLGTIGMFVGNYVMVLLTRVLTFGFYIYLFQFNVFNVADILPIWAVWLSAFLIIDFVFYWYHRASHRVRFLWAIHMNHHSSEEMNFLVAFRQGWFNPFSKLLFFWVIPVFFLDPTMMVVAGAVSTLYGVVTHTQVIGKLGFLEWIFVTPSHHRAHHGSNEEYLDKNYSNMFIFYDRLFGTFQPEKAAVVYGLTNNVNTYNPIKITFMDWQALIRDIRSARSVREALLYILGPPGWKP